MQLHEAIKKARKSLGMSQQALADLANIERKQLSILENGGNVTLATVRKVVAHLPNMQPFTLSGVIGTVVPAMTPNEQAEMAKAALKTLGTVIQSVFGPLGEGRLPTEADGAGIEEAARGFYKSVGLTDEEFDQEIAARAAKQEPQRPLTDEETAAALTELADVLEKTEFGEEEDEQKEPSPSE